MADDSGQHKAASLLQGRYREWQQKREKGGLNLTNSQGDKSRQQQEADRNETGPMQEKMASNERWSSAMTSQKLEQTGADQKDGKNDPASRWQRGGFYAGRLAEGPSGAGQDPDDGQQPKNETDRKVLKEMEAQYWLEMIDKKHRYGSNLKYYHQKWNEEDTRESFFKWLDEGGGKDLDLPDCSREQLEKEQITYLTAEQRRNYLVKVKDGRLYWARNGKPLDTAKGKWKDGGHGRGIVEKGGPEDDGQGPTGEEDAGDDTSSTSSSSSAYSTGSSEKHGSHKEKEHYSSKDPGQSSRKYYTSPKALMDVMLRKTTSRNVWIFMAAGSKDLYVGIKQTGGFQHSSFLYGARVASAGLLQCRNGQLTSLSPLSGHYRAGTEHFKNFVSNLEHEGVDLSAVSISKSLVMIKGIEKYGAVTKKKKSLGQKIKHKLHITTKEDKKNSAEDAENERITKEAIKKEEQGRMQFGETAGAEKQEGSQSNGRQAQEERLPHEDKDNSELSEKQRYERGIALMRRAMAKGFPNKEGGAATAEGKKAAQIQQGLDEKHGSAQAGSHEKDTSDEQAKTSDGQQ